MSPSSSRLVFRLSSDHVALGAMRENSFINMYDSRKGESPVIGIDEKRHIHCGTSALSCREHWTLKDILGDWETQRKISFKVGKEELTQDLNLAFFLGLILKTMKNYAESVMNTTFNDTIIIVPIWFTSSHRVHIKDAGMMAGFEVTRLVNQETIAAYSYHSELSKKSVEPKEVVILILSENFGVTSATAFRYDIKKKQLIMVDDKHLNKSLDLEHSKTKKETVVEVCSSLSFHKRPKTGSLVNSIKEKKVLILTEVLEWREAFMASKELGYEFEEGEYTMPKFLFEEKSIENMQLALSEYQPKQTGPMRDGWTEGSFVKFVYPGMNDKDALPKKLDHEVPFGIFESREKLMVFQEDLFTGNKTTVGTFELKYNSRHLMRGMNTVLVLTFHITSESILSLECVKFRKSKTRKWESSAAQDFSWNTGNLSGGERKNLKRRLEDIIEAKHGCSSEADRGECAIV